MTVQFADLVERKYLVRGVKRAVVASRIHVDTGLSLGTLWQALRGLRVTPETAKRIEEWAWLEHGERIDVGAMVLAPPRGRRVRGEGVAVGNG